MIAEGDKWNHMTAEGEAMETYDCRRRWDNEATWLQKVTNRAIWLHKVRQWKHMIAEGETMKPYDCRRGQMEPYDCKRRGNGNIRLHEVWQWKCDCRRRDNGNMTVGETMKPYDRRRWYNGAIWSERERQMWKSLVEKRNSYRVLVGKPHWKRPPGRPRPKWNNNITQVLKRNMAQSFWFRTGRSVGLWYTQHKHSDSIKCREFLD